MMGRCKGIMRYFNTEGLCKPDEHYMVRLDDRLEKIKRLYVDRGKYFVINRGRQYGKTTTLRALEEYLKDEYLVVSLDFQGISTEEFADEKTFVCAFTKAFLMAFPSGQKEDWLKPLEEFVGNKSFGCLYELFHQLSRICMVADRPIVLLIDGMDSALRNRVLVDFLAQLRAGYMRREKGSAFQSVILAGVRDIRNLAEEIRPYAEYRCSSPWNIAAEFRIDMSFSEEQITDMLKEYEVDHRTGMDVMVAAKEIHQYTLGHPYFVSAICKCLDEDIPDWNRSGATLSVWNEEGIAEAVKLIIMQNTPIFDDIIKQFGACKELKNLTEEILNKGRWISFCPAQKVTGLGIMCGFLKEKDNHVVISNRIFERYLLNMFADRELVNSVF